MRSMQPKWIYLIMALFTGLTGAVYNYLSLLLVRFLFGAGEAGAFPGMARAVFSWIPMNQRGLVQGINFSGSRLGAAFALPLVAWMVTTFGWRTSFIILGIIGFGWAAFWYAWFRDDPTEHKSISVEEREYILQQRQQTEATGSDAKLNLSVIFRSKNMWLAMLQYFCSNFTFFFTLTWLFPYVKNQYNLDAVDAAFYASAPLICGALGNWFSGWLIDRIYKSDHWVLSRKLPATIGFTLAALGLIGSIYMDSVGAAIIFLSIAIFGADMTLPPSWAFCIDIGRKNAGAVSGTMNMAGNVGSFVTALAFPYLKAWAGSVTPFFFLGAVLNILAIIVWQMKKPDKPVEEY